MPDQSYIACENDYTICIFFDTFLRVNVDLEVFENWIDFLE
jgi:hypothetical protein